MAKEKKFFCSNCLLFLSELEAMETHDQSHDIVRVMPEPAPDPPRSGEPHKWPEPATSEMEAAKVHVREFFPDDDPDAIESLARSHIAFAKQNAAPPSLEECAKKMAEAYGWGWEHMSDAAKLTFTKMAKAALDTLQAYFAGAVGQPPYMQDLPYLLKAADDVLAEQSLLNQKFTDKQNDLFTALMPWRDVNGKFEAAQMAGDAPKVEESTQTVKG